MTFITNHKYNIWFTIEVKKTVYARIQVQKTGITTTLYKEKQVMNHRFSNPTTKASYCICFTTKSDASINHGLILSTTNHKQIWFTIEVEKTIYYSVPLRKSIIAYKNQSPTNKLLQQTNSRGLIQFVAHIIRLSIIQSWA
ncbi:unnamed protein product [Vicia faba]|uniref:Uncharacterized protein n=1 Tax=Vicia faba TaxID=3906 RepID=A0AAV1AJ49_VICFA|nr:unnamed protein product [Vicia faba]